jgi:hypothetical protein
MASAVTAAALPAVVAPGEAPAANQPLLVDVLLHSGLMAAVALPTLVVEVEGAPAVSLAAGLASPANGPTIAVSGLAARSGGGDTLTAGPLFSLVFAEAAGREYVPPLYQDSAAWNSGGSALGASPYSVNTLRGISGSSEASADRQVRPLDKIAERSFLLNSSLSQADDNALNVERLIQRQKQATRPPNPAPPANKPETPPEGAADARSPGEEEGETNSGFRGGLLWRLMELGAASVGATAIAGWLHDRSLRKGIDETSGTRTHFMRGQP